MLALIASTIKGSSNGGTITTDAIDTTGADLIVVGIAYYAGPGAGSAPVLSDSQGNSWTGLTIRTGGQQATRLYYCAAPNVGVAHTFTATGTSIYPTIAAEAFSGAHASPFDQESGAGGTSETSQQPGSITPSEDGCLLISSIDYGIGTSASVNGGFTAITQDTAGGNNISGGISRLIQTTAAAANPTWSWTGAGDGVAAMASFKPAAGGAATTATLSGPSSGTVNVASTNFTVALDGSYSGTITPATSGTGTFSPTSLSGDGTFAYTPTTTSGSPHNISISASPSLSYSGSPIAYAVNAAPVTVSVTDSDWFFSPFNWRKSSSTYAQTNNPGAYFKTKFTGTSCKLNVDVSPNSGESSGNYPTIAYSVDGGVWTRYQLTSADTQLTLASGLSAGTHTLIVVLVGAWWQDDRWTTPASVLRVTGLELDGGASLAAPDLLSGRAILYADSNGEGYEALAVGVSVANQDAGQAFPLLIGRALDCEIGVIAFAGQGYTATGGGNVPDLQDSWDFYDNSRSRLDGGGLFQPPPDYVISTMGQNDSAGVQAAVEALIPTWRAAAPDAEIFCCSPSTLGQVTAIAAGVAASGDSHAYFVTTAEAISSGSTGIYGNSNHMSVRGHARYAAILSHEIAEALGGTGGGPLTGYDVQQVVQAATGQGLGSLPAGPGVLSSDDVQLLGQSLQPFIR